MLFFRVPMPAAILGAAALTVAALTGAALTGPALAQNQPIHLPDPAMGSGTQATHDCQRVPNPQTWADDTPLSELPALPLSTEYTADPLVSSHRGARYLAPENTLEAFRAAIAYGVDVLETDVRRSADGVYVVVHDTTVDRTTDGTGPVDGFTLAELKELDASQVDGQDWSALYPDGATIPTLEEVAALARDHGVGLELDMKVAGVDVQLEVADLVARHGLLEQSIFNHFDIAVSQRYPDAEFIYNRGGEPYATAERPGALYALATATEYDVFGSRFDKFTVGDLNQVHDACGRTAAHSYDFNASSFNGAEGLEAEREVLRAMRQLRMGAQTDQPDLAAQELSGPVHTELIVGPADATPGRLAMTREEVVDGSTHKQGVARVELDDDTTGWVHSWNEGLVRTDDLDVPQAINPDAIPADLRAAGFDHISDPDAHNGVLYVPIEQGDYAAMDQKVVLFDPATLQPLPDAPVLTLPISHIAWLSVTQAPGEDPVIWTTSDFTDVTTVQRFWVREDHTVEPFEADPLAGIELDTTLQRVQGGDVDADGTLWISTDDAGNRLYAVDPSTGATTEVGSMGHLRAGGPANLTGPAPADGYAKAEGEGIDATPLPSGDVHTLAIDAVRGVSHFAHFAHRSVMPAVPDGHACLVNAGNGAPIPHADLGDGVTTGPDGCAAIPEGADRAFAGHDGALPAGQHPLYRAHAHNDYEPHDTNRRPLLDALDHGFTSIEVDVYLVGDQLVVGHDYDDLRPGRTLQTAYLDPLRDRVNTLGGVYRADEQRFQLMIDVKTEAESTWAALDRVLADYNDIVVAQSYDEVLVDRPVQVIISGNRARSTMEGQAVLYANYDGRIPDDLDESVPAAFISMNSQNYSHLGWDGEGQPTAAQQATLREAVDRSHAAGRTTRFWASPHDERVWQWLYDAGSDWINADDLGRLETFLRAQGD